MEITFMVVPVINNAINTPEKENGNANMIINGYVNDSN